MIIIETCPKCGHDLLDEVILTNPPIHAKHCSNCGWCWEGGQEEVVRVPFVDNNFVLDYPLTGNFEQSACVNCPTNPKNGGNGICGCILGLPVIS